MLQYLCLKKLVSYAWVFIFLMKEIEPNEENINECKWKSLRKDSLGCYRKSSGLWIEGSRSIQNLETDLFAVALHECELLHDLCLAVAGPSSDSSSSHYSIVTNYTVTETEYKNVVLWKKLCPGCESYFLSFPNITAWMGHNSVTYLRDFPILSSGFTTCFWLQREQGGDIYLDGTVFSYIYSNSDLDRLTLYGIKESRTAVLILNGDIEVHFLFPIFDDEKIGDFHWDEICFTVNTNESSSTIFINGEAVGAVAEPWLNTVKIPGNGRLVFGQRQKCFTGCYEDKHQFRGEIYRFNIWDVPLMDTEINKNFWDQKTSCSCILGNVLSVSPYVSHGLFSCRVPFLVHGLAEGNMKLINYPAGSRTNYGPWESCEKTTNNTARNATIGNKARSTSVMNEVILASINFILLVILLILVALVIRIYRVERKKRYDVKQKSSMFTKTSDHEIIFYSSVDASSVKIPASTDSDQDNYFQMTHISDDTELSENLSPTFSKAFDFQKEHIYAEIHPKYLPQILRGKHKENKHIGRENSAVYSYSTKYPRAVSNEDEELESSKKFERRFDNDSVTSHSASSISGKTQRRDLKHLETWYELPMESTFIHTRMSGEII